MTKIVQRVPVYPSPNFPQGPILHNHSTLVKTKKMKRDTKLLPKHFILILPVVLLGPFSVPGSSSGQYVVFSPSAFLNSKLCSCNLEDFF